MNQEEAEIFFDVLHSMNIMKKKRHADPTSDSSVHFKRPRLSNDSRLLTSDHKIAAEGPQRSCDRRQLSEVEREDFITTGSSQISLNWLKQPSESNCPDVSDLIFSHLDTESLLTCRRVSKSFRKAGSLLNLGCLSGA